MKMIVVVALALVAVVAAAPAAPASPEAAVIAILRSEFDQQPEGGYHFSYETENGITRNEQGELKEVLDEDNKPRSVIIVRGSYTFINNEGKTETVNYVADQDGYHAEGDSIPKPARR